MNRPGNFRDSEDDGVNLPAVKKTQFLEIDQKVAAYTSYIPICPLNLIISGVWFAMEPKGSFSKFHATQSLILGGAFFVVLVVGNLLAGTLTFVPFIGPLLGGILSLALMLLSLAFLIVSIKCMIDVHHGREARLPYIGDIAHQLSTGP